MSYMDFSSWPREQEQSFVVYEQHSAEAGRKGMTAGIIAGLAFLVITVGIYAGVAPDKRDMTKDMNMGNLTKKSRVSTPAPAPQQAPTPAPATAPAPAPEAPKAEAPKAEAPAPAAPEKK